MAFKQTPDNLRSTDTFEGILGFGVGPHKGPVKGLQSISLDGTPIEDSSGKLNFQDTIVITADGNPAKYPQVITPQLGAAGSPISVSLQVGNTNTGGAPGPFVVKTAPATGAEFLDLRFVVNQLYEQNEDGIFETTANLEIQMKPIGATNWISPQLDVPDQTYSMYGQTYRGNLVAYVPRENYDLYGNWVLETHSGYLPIKGKTTSSYIYELRIAVPNTGAYANRGWDVRVRLREPENLDADPNFAKRTITWESISSVFPNTMGVGEGWRGVAWMQVVAKASDQLTGLPEVSAVCDTKIVQVPPLAVYDPENRTYTGEMWDGSWGLAYTNDPAWVINDALSDSLSGVSLLAAGSHLNKWDALEASKFFSEKVPDGAGGLHSRYSLNLIVDQPQKAEDLIQYMAGAVGGFAWDSGNGEWRMVVDKVSNAVDIFTLDNIVGEFQYSHTDVDTRYNHIKATFLNEEQDYRQDFVQVFDSPSIALHGLKPTSIVAVGCTNRQEALRRAMVRLRSSINETRMVNFMTNRRGKLLQQFSNILVADADMGERTTGRIVSIAPDRLSIELRDTVRLQNGVAYNICFAVPNPLYDPDTATQPTSADYVAPTLTTEISVVNTSAQRGDVTTLYLDEALPTTVAQYLSVALKAVGLPTAPVLYRVIEIKPGEGESAEFVSITAIEVDVAKQSAADSVTASDSVLSPPPAIVPPPIAPASGKVLSLVEIPNNYTLVASWVRPDGNWIAGYQVKYRANGGAWITIVENTKETSVELLTTPTGTYDIEVRALDRLGRYSSPLIDTLDVNGYDPTSLTMSLTKDSVQLPASATGVVTSYAPASGAVNVLYGLLNVTANCTFAIISQINCVGTITAGGSYAVTSMAANTASLTIQATYNGVSVTKVFSVAKALAGASGAAGAAAISGMLSNDSTSLIAYADGTVVSYAPAHGTFRIFSGVTDVTSNFTLSTISNPQGLLVTYTGQDYAITDGFDPGEDTASVTIRARGTGVYAGISIDKVYTIAKVKAGYEIVSALPTTNLFEGRMAYLTADGKLYHYKVGDGWTAEVKATDISGTLRDVNMTFGSRQIYAQNFDFRVNTALNRVEWDAGVIFWTDDAGTQQLTSVASGHVDWPGSYVHLYWAKGAGTLTSTVGDWATGIAGDNIEMCVWQGGGAMAVMYGSVIFDGSRIYADSITATQIAADTITANEIAADSITANEIAAGTITAAELAAENLITASAQIGDLIVDTIHIKNGAMTGWATATGSTSVGTTALTVVSTTYTPYSETSLLEIMMSGVLHMDSGVSGIKQATVSAYRNGVQFFYYTFNMSPGQTTPFNFTRAIGARTGAQNIELKASTNATPGLSLDVDSGFLLVRELKK